MSTIEPMAKLAADLAGDDSVAQRVCEQEVNTRFIRMLIGLRISKKLTQRQLAPRMGVSSSKICRMEALRDDQLNWGDVVKYTNALGVNMSVLVDDPSLPAAERIKHHVLTTHALLEQLRALTEKTAEGEALTAKITEFYGDVLFNFLAGFSDSFSKLPQSGPIQIPFGVQKPGAETAAANGAELCAH